MTMVVVSVALLVWLKSSGASMENELFGLSVCRIGPAYQKCEGPRRW